MNNNLNSVTHASMFGRTMANMGKLGAYYTDIGHCKRIGRLIKWPEDKEVCVLERFLWRLHSIKCCSSRF